MIRFAGALGFILLLAPAAIAQEDGRLPPSAAGADDVREWPTPGEQRGWFAPTTPSELGDYLTALADSFEQISLDTLALVGGGSVEPDSVLPVLLARVRGPVPERRERVRVLVLGGQRGNEPSGPEVSAQMIRGLVVGDVGALLADLDVAFVPAVNPWGLLWWVRDDPSGVDPAHDHSLLRSPASKAIHEFVSEWQPHLVVELREIRPTVYRVQAGLPKHPNVDPELSSFGRFYLLPYVANELVKVSVSFREHVAAEPELEERSPLVGGAEGLPEEGYLTPGPLGADRARNAFALEGSLSIMLGVASLDGADGLPSRVEMLYMSLGYLLEVAAAHGDGLRERALEARLWSHDSATGPPVFSLRHTYERDEDRPSLVWLVWNDRGQIVTQTTDRWRSVVRRQLVLPVPAAWLIEPAGREWVDLIESHGFAVERLVREVEIEVASYPVGAASQLPLGLHDELPLDAAPDGSGLLVRGDRRFPEGAWVVRSRQPRARLLFALIEPWSQDAPLGREASPESRDTGEYVYPVHRIDAETLERLRTEPATSVAVPGRGTD